MALNHRLIRKAKYNVTENIMDLTTFAIKLLVVIGSWWLNQQLPNYSTNSTLCIVAGTLIDLVRATKYNVVTENIMVLL